MLPLPIRSPRHTRLIWSRLRVLAWASFPDRTVPRALLYGASLIIVIYLAVNAALLHVLSPAEMGASKLAAADALARVWGPPAHIAIAILALVASLSVLNVSMRWREPPLRCPYRAFGYPWVPGFALITAAGLLVVFVLGNTGPSLLAIGVVAVTFPLFRFIQRGRSPAPGLNA